MISFGKRIYFDWAKFYLIVADELCEIVRILVGELDRFLNNFPNLQNPRRSATDVKTTPVIAKAHEVFRLKKLLIVLTKIVSTN